MNKPRSGGVCFWNRRTAKQAAAVFAILAQDLVKNNQALSAPHDNSHRIPLMNEYRLVQVADVHLGDGQEHHLDNWNKVIDWIARERPDIVVANGDLIMSDPDTEADYAFARSQFDRLPVACRYLPGNHDIGDNIVAGAMPLASCALVTEPAGLFSWAANRGGFAARAAGGLQRRLSTWMNSLPWVCCSTSSLPVCLAKAVKSRNEPASVATTRNN